MRKGGIAPGLHRHIGGVGSLNLFIKSIEFIPSTFDIRHSAVLRFAFPYFPHSDFDTPELVEGRIPPSPRNPKPATRNPQRATRIAFYLTAHSTHCIY